MVLLRAALLQAGTGSYISTWDVFMAIDSHIQDPLRSAVQVFLDRSAVQVFLDRLEVTDEKVNKRPEMFLL